MTRPFSLRARVALASAGSAALVVMAMSVMILAAVQTHTGRQVDTVLRSLEITGPGGVQAIPALPLGSAPATPAVPRSPAPVVLSTTAGVPLDAPVAGPAVPATPGSHVLVSDGSGYQWELPTPGSQVTVAATVPRSVVASAIDTQREYILLVGVAAIVLAAGLGWVFAHRAVLPLRRLTAATQGVGSRLALDVSPRPGSTETAELAGAMNRMLDRIAAERRHTAEALAAARDFAATSAHELRTPLTSMRTDLEVLRSMPLPETERAAILDDVLTAQRSVENTLLALERLALGELTTAADFEDVDLDELIDQVVDDAPRAHPGLAVASAVTEPVRMRGLPAGLRCILDNAVTNAVRHGAATRVRLDARTEPDGTVTLIVDDDGSGVPEAERERVFQRFSRGSTTAPGSGLGLALVAQQARLHGGTVCLEDSPLGGARLRVTLSGPVAP
ncbi:sensor histidine kinase [Nocardia terpenica]|uniref:sensor histidine kinase n=1 Tax=Nocardia terpenica TaxID=455432 RepID=UPI002FE2C1B9